MRENRI